MARIKEDEFKNHVQHVEFNGQVYYSIQQAKDYLKEDTEPKEILELPITGKSATFKDIIEGRKKELSDFDKKIIQALNFNPKDKK